MYKPDYSISTPENVDLHLELAGIGNRVLACLIDTVITLAVIVGLGAMFWGLWMALTVSGLSSSGQSIATAVIIMVYVLAAFFIWFGYFIFFEGIWQGQTPGKKLVNVRVIEQNGQPVGWPAVFLRNCFRFFDEGVLLIGLLSMIVDRNERRFGDLAAGTLVIKERLSELDTTAIQISVSEADARSLDIGAVSPQEYDILVSFLKRRSKLAKSQRPLVARELERHFREKLNEPNGKEGSEPFLERIYTAYRSRADS